MALLGALWLCQEQYGIFRSNIALPGVKWYCLGNEVANNDLSRMLLKSGADCQEQYGIARSIMALPGAIWHFQEQYSIARSNMALPGQ